MMNYFVKKSLGATDDQMYRLQKQNQIIFAAGLVVSIAILLVTLKTIKR